MKYKKINYGIILSDELIRFAAIEAISTFMRGPSPDEDEYFEEDY